MNGDQICNAQTHDGQPCPLDDDQSGISPQWSSSLLNVAPSDAEVDANSALLSQHEKVQPADEELAQALPRGKCHSETGFHSIWRNWWWEIVTWWFGTAALAVIVTLLMVFNGRPSWKWHSRIQITAMISALSQLTQSALTVTLSSAIGQLKWVWFQDPHPVGHLDRFDEASRGPEGSLRLILSLVPWEKLVKKEWTNAETNDWTSRSGFSSAARLIWFHRKPHLASFAALTIVMLLAFSTVAQQAISIQQISFPAEFQNATMTRAVNYSNTDGNSYFVNSCIFAPSKEPLRVVADAGDAAMAAATINGMTSSYAILSNIPGNCSTGHCTWEPYGSLAVCARVDDISDNIVPTGNHDTPFQFADSRAQTPKMDKGMQTMWVSTINFTASFDRKRNQSTGTLTPIAEVFIMYYPVCGKERSGDYYKLWDDPKGWKAFKGTFSLCIQSLNSTVTKANVTTEILPDPVEDRWEIARVNESSLINICGTMLNDTTRYCTSNFQLNLMGTALANMFKGWASLIPAGDNYYAGDWMLPLSHDLLGPVVTECNHDARLGFEKFERRINNVAVAMSNSMRTARSSSLVTGTAYSTDLSIQVEALWLLFPIFLWFCITFVLIATVLRTSKHKVPVWKASQIAMAHCMQLANKRDSAIGIKKEHEKEYFQLVADKHEHWHLTNQGEI